MRSDPKENTMSEKETSRPRYCLKEWKDSHARAAG